MMRGTCGMLVAVAVLAGACSDGDGEAAPTTTTPTTVQVATAPVPTTPPPTPTPTTPNPAPPTTSASSTSAPASTPPPTTPDPLHDLAAAIERDLNAGEQALLTIGADPGAAGTTELAQTYFAGKALENVLAGVDTLVRDDLVLMPNLEVPNEIRLTSAPLLDQTVEPWRATAETCRIDASQLWARVNDTDVRAPINTTVVRIRSASRFVLIGDVWRLDGGDVIAREEGEVTCS